MARLTTADNGESSNDDATTANRLRIFGTLTIFGGMALLTGVVLGGPGEGR